MYMYVRHNKCAAYGWANHSLAYLRARRHPVAIVDTGSGMCVDLATEAVWG